MTCYLVKEESIYVEADEWYLTDQGRHPWHVARGDLVVTYSWGQFISLARVTAVDETKTVLEVTGQKFYSYSLSLSTPVLLPEDRTVENLMYSLQRVTYFYSPHRHFSHRSTLSRQDLETIRTGRIHLPRTLYFGLLRRLPKEWRRHFEGEAMRRAMRHGAGPLPDPEGSPPVAELRILIQETLLESLTLGAEVHNLRHSVQGPDLDRPLVAAFPEPELDEATPWRPLHSPWTVDRFLTKAAEGQQSIRQQFEALPWQNLTPWLYGEHEVELPPELPPESSAENQHEKVAAWRLPFATDEEQIRWKPHQW